ncbi:hypothetical protein KY285_033397 [Solanum tuberosum]|nr:hypothetical protein KY285_033397 [Solanum tuberosum]
MDLHILWTLLVGVVVADPGSSGAFLVLMVLLPFITKTNVVHKDTIKEDVLQEIKLVQVNQLNHLLRKKATDSGRGRGTGRVVGARARASSSTQPPRASSQTTTNNESGREKGTRRFSSSIGVPTQSHGTATNTETVNGRGRGRGRGAETGRGRGMHQERNVNEGLGRGRGMAQHSQTSSEATCSGRGLERGKRPIEHEDTNGGQTRPFKRPRMVGVGIYQAEDGFTTLNSGLPSRRVINTGTRVTKRVDVVTGDIGYTPVRGFKWKGKTTITSSNLERMRAEKVIQTRSAAAATGNNQSQTTSSKKTFVPWK